MTGDINENERPCNPYLREYRIRIHTDGTCIGDWAVEREAYYCIRAFSKADALRQILSGLENGTL
jgi:hypothetical protein